LVQENLFIVTSTILEKNIQNSPKELVQLSRNINKVEITNIKDFLRLKYDNALSRLRRYRQTGKGDVCWEIEKEVCSA